MSEKPSENAPAGHPTVRETQIDLASQMDLSIQLVRNFLIAYPDSRDKTTALTNLQQIARWASTMAAEHQPRTRGGSGAA